MDIENDSPFMSAAAGDNMDLGQEPSNDETTPKVEDPTINNDDKAPEIKVEEEVVQQVEEGGNSKHSSKLISELGEDRKKIVEKFIESARKSGASADELKELVQGDVRLEKYVKKKFGNDYDKLMEGTLTSEEGKVLTEDDRVKIEKQAYAKAQLEVFKEQDAQLKEKQFNLFAQSNGLTSTEADTLREKADILATHDDYETALSDALLLVNRSKALAADKKVQFPGGSGDKQVNNAPKVDTADYVGLRNASSDSIAKSSERVEKNMQTDSMGQASYEFKFE